MSMPDREIYTYLKDGRVVDANDLRPNDIDIEFIASALSKICRFNGQTPKFYSVAEHSVYVSQLVEPQFKLHALLHDAAEAYIGDIITPVKDVTIEVRDMELRITARIAAQLDVDISSGRHKVKQADADMLRVEAHQIYNAEFPSVFNEPKLQYLEHREAYEFFMQAYRKYTFIKNVDALKQAG